MKEFFSRPSRLVHLSSSRLKSRAATDSFSQALMNFTLKTGPGTNISFRTNSPYRASS